MWKHAGLAVATTTTINDAAFCLINMDALQGVSKLFSCGSLMAGQAALQSQPQPAEAVPPLVSRLSICFMSLRCIHIFEVAGWNATRIG